MTNTDIPNLAAIFAPLPGDSQLGGCVLVGRWLKGTASKLENGTAFIVQLDERSQELVRLHAADPTRLMVDLEDLPASRLPGMGQYIGGAFVRLFGRQTWGNTTDQASGFDKFLGDAEVLEKEGQE